MGKRKGEMGVSINGGSPKWMVYKGKSHLEMGDLGVTLFQEMAKRLENDEHMINMHAK